MFANKCSRLNMFYLHALKFINTLLAPSCHFFFCSDSQLPITGVIINYPCITIIQTPRKYLYKERKLGEMIEKSRVNDHTFALRLM